MTAGSRVRKRPIALAFVLSSLIAGTAVAAEMRVAQEGPVRLMPRRDLSTPIPPVQDQQPAVPSGAEQPATDIQVKDLGTVDPEAVGTLDLANGGFPSDMWLGTPRTTIRRLIGSIPPGIRSPVMRSLAERLLLTAAALPPADAAAQPGDTRSSASMLALRAGRLQAMGMVEQARALIQASPLRASDPELARLLVENRLLASDFGGACEEAKRSVQGAVTPFWQRVTIFCQLLAGDSAAAQLGTNVLAETPGFDDPAFLALVDALAQKRPVEIVSLPSPDALHLAMLRVANVPVPEDALDNAPPDVLRAIGISPNTELNLRLAAAERAAQVGAIKVDRLAKIYLGIEFHENELSTALSTASDSWTPRGRALLYRAANRQTVPTAKAAVLQKAFELGRADGQLLLLVRLYNGMLRELPVSADLAWFAGEAATGLLAMGERTAAQPWLSLLRERRLRDRDARAARDRLWSLAVLAADPRYAVTDGEAFKAWLAVLREQQPEEAFRMAGFALLLMQSIGLQVPEDYWQAVLQPPRRTEVRVPPAAFTPALENAVRSARLGETVLLSILMVGADGTRDADPVLLRDVIAALRSVGLEAEGQALALEAALTNGL